MAPILLLLFLPTTVHSERYLSDVSRMVYPPGWSGPETALGGRNVDTVGYDIARRDRTGGDIYPWFLLASVVVRFAAGGQQPPSSHIFASASWPRDHPDAPARAVWRDSARDEVLWRLAQPTGRQVAELRRTRACLADATVAALGRRGTARTPQEVLTLGSGARVAVIAFPTRSAAAAHARRLDRLLRAAGRRDSTTIARHGGVVATYPRRVTGEERRALRRCL